MPLSIEGETKFWSDAQLAATNTIHQLSISSTKQSSNDNKDLEDIIRNSWNILLSQSGERFWSEVQTIYWMGVLMLFQGPRLGKVVSIYIIDSSEFHQKRNWKWRNLNFPISVDLLPAQSEILLRSWWVIAHFCYSSQHTGSQRKDKGKTIFSGFVMHCISCQHTNTIAMAEQSASTAAKKSWNCVCVVVVFFF